MNILGHGHHATLLSFAREYEERKQQILENKPASEHAIRLRCMWQLTEEQIAELPPAVVEAYRTWDEAGRARVEAYRTWVEADRAWVEACRTRDEADRAWDEACRTWDEADRAWVEACRADHAELEAWHARHCPALRTPDGCPWNGERLVGVGE